MEEGDIGHGDSLHDFQRKRPEKHKMLAAHVAKEAFDDVIPRFHKVRGEPISPTSTIIPGAKDELANLSN